MSKVTEAVRLAILVFVLSCCGCEKGSSPPEINNRTETESQRLAIYSQYSPVKIDILPLSGLVGADDTGQSRIRVYVSLLDSFGSQIKSPCVFRFELYQRVQRSGEPKGTRIVIWPDIDVTEPVPNNQYWRNFLRAYEFFLPFEPQAGQTYILEVTCLCPNEKRLAAEYILGL
jgi:hypothetical protein